ncbi:hypothetical protein acdb102_01960 [Acidothermaceae bacterium B102]|nr:hypothetical protein acdb102_01960 [Acidothermaceae bacterium B102]
MTALRLLPELEDALRQIPGVRAASVVTGPDAQPTEIHVLADRLKPAKQVVRDIQSLAMARYDLDIDHRIVSVVQIDDGDGPALRLAVPPTAAETTIDVTDNAPAPAEVAPRPLVEAVVVRTSHSEAEVTVTLAFGGDVFIGSASGSSAIASRPRLVARATLDALGELLGTPADIEHATVLPVGSRSVAVSVLQVQVPRTGEQVLSGSAVVRGDESDAVARSVLDALNRRLIG